jgi:hypothetical protein
VLDYSKNVGSNWNLAYFVGGAWNLNLYIPFPYPISFSGLNFQFVFNYYADVKIAATNILALPYQVKVSH